MELFKLVALEISDFENRLNTKKTLSCFWPIKIPI